MPRPVFYRPIAHRGLHDRVKGVIENSHAAFEAAIEAGYAIECDVQLSQDNVPFIFHDDTLDRLTARNGRPDVLPIAEIVRLELTGSSAHDTPQRFDDFLAQISGRTLLQIELKKQPDARRTIALAFAVAAALKDYRGTYALESFDPRLIVELRRAGSTAPIGIVTHGYDEKSSDRDVGTLGAFALRHLLHWPITRFDFISCRDNSLDLTAVRFFRRHGLPITAWTIRSADGASAALQHSDQIVFEGFVPLSA
ncbi:MAG: glycerophosphodiester phosphodiesterase family protein [Devosia sp.]